MSGNKDCIVDSTTIDMFGKNHCFAAGEKFGSDKNPPKDSQWDRTDTGHVPVMKTGVKNAFASTINL